MHATVEDGRRATKPDVRLGINPLEAKPVEDLLRSHVEPANIHIGTMPLEGVLQQRELVTSVRRVQNEWGAVVRGAGGGGKEG